jgi:cell wall-associated NlpC family hydrolase
VLRRCAAIATSVLVCGGLATFAVSAGAAPQPTITQVQAKVDKLTTQEDVAVQQLDQVTQELRSAKRRLLMIKHEVTIQRAKFQQMRAEISQIATTAYESGNMTSVGALLTSNNPQAVLSQASVLLQLSNDRSAQVKQFITAARQLSESAQMAIRTDNAILALSKQRQGRERSIHKALAKQKAVLATLTAQQAAAVTTVGTGGSTSATYTGTTATQAGKAVAYAYSKLGDPYLYGGTGPNSFDCSGLVQAAWASAGVAIARVTNSQAVEFPSVARSLLQPGDLVFFAGDSHVAIYVGGGDIIDAPTTGQFVEKLSLSSSWYSANYDGAVRP